ncbi:MAG: hypothetical protein WCW56_01245 [Candidatus Paceibacterota bacterium]
MLTLSGTRVTIYGHFIDGDKVFARLNASCETAIVWRPWKQIKRWQTGFFVKLNEFEKQYDDDLWVALVGVPTNNFQEVIPY